MRVSWWAVAGAAAIMTGCNHEPGSTVLTRGDLTLACDEAVYSAFVNEVGEFQTYYPEAKLKLRKVEAREAVSLFGADSVRVIVTARELNQGERTALKNAKIPLDEYKVALSAVAVIVHPGNPLKRIRMTELDSIFSGTVTRWPERGGIIEAVAAGRNSSTNEAFKNAILQGHEFGPTIDYVDSSEARLERVAKTPNAIALISVNWLKEKEQSVRALEVGGPSYRPDTTAAAGQYYAPWQAYVFLGHYPIVTPVYMYSREERQDVALGIIAYVCSAPGQKIVQNHGLVPVTMPVRLVSLTSEQVH